MSESDSHTTGAEGKERNWERVAATAHLHEYEDARETGMSQRQFAEQAGIHHRWSNCDPCSGVRVTPCLPAGLGTSID